MNPLDAPPGCTSEDTSQSCATQTTDTEQGDHCHEEHTQTVTAIWMLNLTGDLAKETEDLFIFLFFFSFKKLLTKSYGIRIGYCQETLVMDTVRNARLEYTRQTETCP